MAHDLGHYAAGTRKQGTPVLASQFLERLKGRMRHGLLTQEILDSGGRVGIRLMPYLVVDESPDLDAGLPPAAANHVVRPLTADDMPLLASMPGREREAHKARERLQFAECLGLFVDGRLVGYTWSRRDRIVHGGKVELHRLGPEEAYLFDIYVNREFRGHGLAHVMRQESYRHLAARGIRRFFSISAYFNESTRKFKSRLGARDLELRILFKLRSVAMADFRLRRYVPDAGLSSRRAYFMRG